MQSVRQTPVIVKQSKGLALPQEYLATQKKKYLVFSQTVCKLCG